MVIQLKKFLGKNVSILEPAHLKGETKQLIEKIKQGEKIQHYETSRLRKGWYDNKCFNNSFSGF